MGRRNDLTGGDLRRSAGGWQGVRELKRNKERWQGDERVLGDGDFVERVLSTFEEGMKLKDRLKQEGWNIEWLAGEVCRMMKTTQEDLLRRSRSSKYLKRMHFSRTGENRDLGITKKELSEYLNIGSSSNKECAAWRAI